MYWDFDTKNEDGLEYRMDNCQLRHSYVCSKARSTPIVLSNLFNFYELDGSTVLIAELASTVKAGTTSSETDYTFWLLVFISLILFLILLCIICNGMKLTSYFFKRTKFKLVVRRKNKIELGM